MKYNKRETLQKLQAMKTLKNPAVSVVLTVYNGEKYLPECLDSIMSQTLRDIEIICVDDASTDETPQILENYRDRMTVITNAENCMAGESRNRGFQKATGEYVIFLDADDIFEPDMLQKAYYKAKSCEADVCIFKEDLFSDSIENRANYAYVEPLMKKLGERSFFSPQELSDVLFSLWNGWAWDKLFRREFIMETGLKFQKLKSSNDGFFVHAALASAARISLLNEILVHHRTGNGNSVSNTRDRAWESCLLYLKELRRYLLQKELFLCYERSYLNWSLDFLYWNYQTLNDVNREKLADAMRQFFTNELNVQQYDQKDFYNEFYRWFADCIIRKEESKIPLTEAERFQKTYQLNRLKIEDLKKYISMHQWKAALWGAGIRGRAFAGIYGEDWNDLQCVYDIDSSKHGQELCPGIVIKGFHAQNAENVDCILVLNAVHLLSVLKALCGEKIVLFDMDAYLNMPNEMDNCIIT